MRGAAAAGGVTLDGLFDDLPARTHWERADGWVTWAQWTTLLDRFASRLKHDEARLIACGKAAMRAEYGAMLGALGALVPSAQSVFELQARWVGPSLFHCARFSSQLEPGGTHLRYAVQVVPEVEPCRSWLVLLEGAVAAVPTLGGFPEAQVERLVLDGRRAEWRVALPTSEGDARQPPELSRALVDALFVQQAQLTQAHDELRASSLDFRGVLEGLPLLVAVHQHGVLRWVNTRFAAQFGRAPGELVGELVEELFSEPQHGRLRTLLAEGATGHAVLLAGGGAAMRTLEALAVGPLSLGGKPGSLLLLRDVTDEYEARRRADRSESTLTKLLDALPDLVMRYGSDTTLKGVYGGREFPDRAFVESVVGQRLEDIQRSWGIYDEPRARLMRGLVHDTLRSGQPTARTFDSPSPDGSMRYLLVRAVPLDGDVVLISHDRTAQVGRERRLQHAERMASLGELAAGVVHEVNNPLTTVLASLPVLRRLLSEGGASGAALEVLDELEEGCRRISETTSRMREFSEVVPPERRVVAVADVVERAAVLTRTELRFRARLEVDLAAGLEVWADASELEEVLVNLLVNAAQAMPPGAGPETHHVWLRGRGVGGFAVLEVEDDGVGIAPGVLQRIFDPFFTTRHRRAGRGLGLAISHRIITAHGGTIEARSASGRTTLTVRLPLAAPALPRLERATPAATSRRARVLVIDDEPAVGRSIQRMLSRHEVAVLGDGRAAFTQLRDGELPDLVLCDLMMPGCTGMELYAALRQSRPEALERVAFMSGGTFTPLASEFLKEHGVSVLNKPFHDGVLDALVERVLATGRLELR